MERCSLWLVPPDGSAAHDRLESLIARYTDRYGETVPFDPHVTVVGSMARGEETARTAAASVASDHGPVDISLVRPHCSTTHFQCVFLLADPHTALLSLHKDAAAAFDHDPGLYVPHLSLVYGDIPVAVRYRLVQGFDADALPLTFTADRLRLVDTTGPVADWRTLDEHDL